jgi:hypothetical protein
MFPDEDVRHLNLDGRDQSLLLLVPALVAHARANVGGPSNGLGAEP